MNLRVATPVVETLDVTHLEDFLRIQTAVTAQTSEGFVRHRSPEEIRSYLDGTQGVAFGIRDAGELSAVCLLHVPTTDNPIDGPPFRVVPPAEFRTSLCFLELALVLPAARGRGYQRAFVQSRLDFARSAGMRWVGSGIRFPNVVSWRNLLASGLAIVEAGDNPFFAGLALCCSLTGGLQTMPSDRLHVPADELGGHAAALREGYIGVRLTADEHVVYERLR